MSESSLQPFGRAKLRPFLEVFRSRSRTKEALVRPLARLLNALRQGKAGEARLAQAPALEDRAFAAVRGYLTAHAALLERTTRLEEKAGRLEEAGTPSESARNRAERAREEVAAGLANLRASFAAAAGAGRGGARSFDRAAELLCPAFAPSRPGERPRAS